MHLNIMMDATSLYPKPYHPAEPLRLRDFSDTRWFAGQPKYYTRTSRPVKYYFTDFGISRRYNPDDGPPLEDLILGGDKTVPEFQVSLDPCDPFPTDVYYLGSMIRKTFLVMCHCLPQNLSSSADVLQGYILSHRETRIGVYRAPGRRHGAG
jgi:hypothetical protein